MRRFRVSDYCILTKHLIATHFIKTSYVNHIQPSSGFWKRSVSREKSRQVFDICRFEKVPSQVGVRPRRTLITSHNTISNLPDSAADRPADDIARHLRQFAVLKGAVFMRQSRKIGLSCLLVPGFGASRAAAAFTFPTPHPP